MEKVCWTQLLGLIAGQDLIHFIKTELVEILLHQTQLSQEFEVLCIVQVNILNCWNVDHPHWGTLVAAMIVWGTAIFNWALVHAVLLIDNQWRRKEPLLLLNDAPKGLTEPWFKDAYFLSPWDDVRLLLFNLCLILYQALNAPLDLCAGCISIL